MNKKTKILISLIMFLIAEFSINSLEIFIKNLVGISQLNSSNIIIPINYIGKIFIVTKYINLLVLVFAIWKICQKRRMKK